MLTLNRKNGESILIYPREDLDPETTVRQLFADGPIAIRVHGRKKGGTSLRVAAPDGVLILRGKLAESCK